MLAWFEHVSGPPLLIFIGAILNAIGGIWSAHRSAEVNKKLASQQEQLRSNSDDIHSDVKRILDHLVAEGKISKEDARYAYTFSYTFTSLLFK